MVEKYGDAVNVLGFPCNQFGHQTNEDEAEFLNTLKYVRPGNGFEPKFHVFGKVHVNGKTADPLFKYLRSAQPYPSDPAVDSKGTGANDADVLILPRGGFDDTTITLWSPVTRTDIAWWVGLEKYLSCRLFP